ncbi:MAG: hypothetical protein WD063_08275 [Pirellulales bacterium]
MSSGSIKDDALRLVERLPADATWEDLQYEIYVRQAVEIGLKDSREGRTVPLDEVQVLPKQIDIVAVVHAAREVPSSPPAAPDAHDPE